MIRCLSEKQLWELYEAGGSVSERAHLDRCEACERHYQHLAGDLALIGQVLQEPAPQTVSLVQHQSPSIQWRWVPAVAAVAAAGLIVWGGALVWEPLKMAWTAVSSYDKETVEIARMMEQELMPVLFSTTETGFGSLPEQATDLDYLQAALDGDWPCEQKGQECGTDPLALRAGQEEQEEQEGQEG